MEKTEIDLKIAEMLKNDKELRELNNDLAEKWKNEKWKNGITVTKKTIQEKIDWIHTLIDLANIDERLTE